MIAGSWRPSATLMPLGSQRRNHSPARLQTGKCPTSGGFFAMLLALMGGFCPENAVLFERRGMLTTLFSIGSSLRSV
jgi:hypothetical protein